VPALIGRDHAESVRRLREDEPPVVAGPETAVQKQQRLAFADGVVVEGDAVDIENRSHG